MPRANSHRNNAGGNYARFLYLGFVFIVTLSVLATAGFFVDKLLGTLPLFLLIGLGIGFAGALYHVYQALEKLGNG